MNIQQLISSSIHKRLLNDPTGPKNEVICLPPMKLIEEFFFIDKTYMLISFWHLTNPSGMGQTDEK
jgi:hypothetical protein